MSNVTIIFHFHAKMQPLATWLGVLRKCLTFILCNCLRAYSYVYCILHSFQCVHRDSQRNQFYEQKLRVFENRYTNPSLVVSIFVSQKKNIAVATSHRQATSHSVRWTRLVSESPLTSKVLLGFHVQTAISLRWIYFGLRTHAETASLAWLNVWWELLGMQFPKPMGQGLTSKPTRW